MKIPTLAAGALALLTTVLTPAWADDDLPQFPKIAPPDTLPDPACDPSLAQSQGWAVGTWSSPSERIEISLEHWKASGDIDAQGTAVGIEQCTVHLGASDPKLPGFDAIRTETGALYGGMRQGDAPPRFELFRKNAQ